MRILSFNDGHDGGATLLDGQQLVFCLEADKDSGSQRSHIMCSYGLSPLP